jgi:indolepyruvate ferredoxin oxidoreductase beta subunit
MGRLSKSLTIAEEKWIEALKQTVAPKFVEMNIKAFKLGRGE